MSQVIPQRYTFFAERQVGIGSAAAAIEPFVREAGHDWVDVTYHDPEGVLEKLPGIPGRIKGTLRGVQQVRTGLGSSSGHGQFFLTHNPAVFQQAAIRRIPTVLWTDVTPVQLDSQAAQYGHPETRFELLKRLKHVAVRRTFESARFVLGWSNWARSSFVRDYGLDPAKTGVVHPGIDLRRFRGTEVRTASASNLPRILFVGGDFERKGGSLLLSVFRDALVGRATLDIVTRDKVAESPGVRVHYGLTASSPALVQLFAEANVFVLPTVGDCFSIASMEAMAMRLPVVVSNVGGISDIVEQGRSGYLIPPGDGGILKQHLFELVEDPVKRLAFAARGREIVEEKFDAAKSAKQLIRYLDLASSES
jgi:glycosyltransferase involved in cell wall biosynthesis